MAAISQTLHAKVKGSPAFDKSPSITLVSLEPKSEPTFSAVKRAIGDYFAKSMSPGKSLTDYCLSDDEEEDSDTTIQKAVERMFNLMDSQQIDVIPRPLQRSVEVLKSTS